MNAQEIIADATRSIVAGLTEQERTIGDQAVQQSGWMDMESYLILRPHKTDELLNYIDQVVEELQLELTIGMEEAYA